LDEIEQLGRATVTQLQAKFLELFGQPSHFNHKQFSSVALPGVCKRSPMAILPNTRASERWP
jgi:hypothetical protein